MSTPPLAHPILDSSSPRDWAEDGDFENGRYLCRCSVCHRTFTGHKRRVVCRVCAKLGEAEADRRQQLLSGAGLSGSEWLLVTPHEQARQNAAYADLLLQLSEERALRRELAAAFTRLADCVSETRRANAHYALEDGREVLIRSQALDAEIWAKEAKGREGRGAA